MKLALQRGALVDSAGEDDGLSCLHIAAELRNLEAMQLLLNDGADINKCTSPNNKRLPNYTALRRSCVLGYREVIGFLLEHGAAICVAGRNALVDAAHNNISWRLLSMNMALISILLMSMVRLLYGRRVLMSISDSLRCWNAVRTPILTHVHITYLL